MKIKTLELTGTALDWVVAKCEDLHTGYPGYWSNSVLEAADRGTENPFAYSTNWSMAGPIIERECIAIRKYGDFQETVWQADKWQFRFVDPQAYGPTPLTAAMRCFVASKLGDEIEVPDEL